MNSVSALRYVGLLDVLLLRRSVVGPGCPSSLSGAVRRVTEEAPCSRRSHPPLSWVLKVIRFA